MQHAPKQRLSSLLAIQNGYAFDSGCFGKEGMPLIRIRDLKNSKTTETNFRGAYDNRYVVRSGDFLIGMDGEFVCYEWKGENALLNQRVCRLHSFAKQVHPRFLLFGINSHLKSIEDATSYTTVKHISSRQILDIEMPIPPLKEQERIVAILDQAFAAITAAKAKTESAISEVRLLFERELESLYEELWRRHKLVKLSELAVDITDGDHMPPPKSRNGVPFITISDIDKHSRSIDLSDTFFVSQAYFDALKTNRKPRTGDLLYTVTGSFGIPVKVESDLNFCFQRHIALIRPKPDVRTSWLYYLARSPQFKRQAENRATGTAQKTVSLSVLRSLLVPRASGSDQDAVADRLDRLTVETDRLGRVYQNKLTALAALKQSLLHQAFSGNL